MLLAVGMVTVVILIVMVVVVEVIKNSYPESCFVNIDGGGCIDNTGILVLVVLKRMMLVSVLLVVVLVVMMLTSSTQVDRVIELLTVKETEKVWRIWKTQ